MFSVQTADRQQADRQTERERETDSQIEGLESNCGKLFLNLHAINLCAFCDACKHFGLSDVTLCIYRRFDDTLFETSGARHH